MFRFAHIDYFYLLAFIPAFIALFIWMMIWRKHSLQRFGESTVITQLLPDLANSKLVLKFILKLLAFGLLVFVLAGPQTGSRL